MLEHGGVGGFNFTCDACGRVKFVDVEGFMWAVDHIKEEGWRVRRLVGEWEHTCPACQEEASGG